MDHLSQYYQTTASFRRVSLHRVLAAVEVFTDLCDELAADVACLILFDRWDLLGDPEGGGITSPSLVALVRHMKFGVGSAILSWLPR